MSGFEGIEFKWTFRDYQQKVLDNSKKFLKDKKINIVAAPGSGKTILGLELITRLNSPCIILSPTTTIKNQWGDRFKEAFLDESMKLEDYVSFDLNNIKLINSITYQALHSVIDKVIVTEDDKEIDYSNIDLFKVIRQHDIRTICLDEAHHLQNEWQKALEKFIKGLNTDITIISLTATPPYDASESEWNRYVSVCGEIDDEIFVPKLVKERTLCPHQDYIMFNYPSLDEIESFKRYRLNAIKAIEEIKQLSFINELDYKITNLNSENEIYLYKNSLSFINLYYLLNYYGLNYNVSLFKKIGGEKLNNELDIERIQFAFTFLLEDKYLINEEEKEYLVNILKEKSLFHRNKIELDLDEKLKRKLISSTGKLNSISRIVSSERDSLNDNLRMLILTDYIKKEEIVNVGKNIDMDNISVVSIFEEVRKKTNFIDIGCLSGTLVVLPIYLKEILINQYGVNNKDFKIKELENTKYAIYDFKVSNKDKVDIVSRIFEDGYIKVLIGTQALLGEGWDSPCINSLILASYVGSFMLSNQMRGRAIRSYKKDTNKTANIWHLVTLEPDYIFEDIVIKNESNLNSSDYKTLARRFDCFMAPNYASGKIENGIERISYIKPPFNKEGIESINKSILELANDRENMAKIWDENVKDDTNIVVQNKINHKMPLFSLFNTAGLLFWSMIVFNCFNLIFIKTNISFIQNILVIIVLGYAILQIYKLGILYLNHFTKKRSLRSFSIAILKTLKELSLVNKDVELNIKCNKETKDVFISLKNATLYEQNLFNKSLKELLSPIDDVRYIVVKKNYFGKYNYKYSYACPSCFDDNNEMVNIFKFYLLRSIGNLDIKYVLNKNGEDILINAKRQSYIKMDNNIQTKQKSI